MKNIQMNHGQKGFTLIELMIVVAIIGILAAIAIPQYQDYIARTQMNTAYGEISAYKTAIEERLMRGTATDLTVADDRAAIGLVESNLASDIAASYTGSVAADGTGTIIFTLDGNTASSIKNSAVELQRVADGTWSCEIDTTNAGSWKDSYLPGNCTVK